MHRLRLASLAGPLIVSACCINIGGPFDPPADGGVSGADGGRPDAGATVSRLRPNLLLLVDKSGSMNDPASPSGPPKLAELKSATSSFLAAYSTARVGLVFFPSDNVCGAAASLAQALPSPTTADDTPADSASSVNNQLVLQKVQAVTPGGGTPTNTSLAWVGTYDGLLQADGRADVVILVTDGLPNCNPGNPNSCANATACNCTLSSCGTPGSSFCTLGCLDQQGAVDAIAALKVKQVLTAVIGIGADVATGTGSAALTAMAQAGGLARACPNGTDVECGGAPGACAVATKTCAVGYYQTSNATELNLALSDVANRTAPKLP